MAYGHYFRKNGKRGRTDSYEKYFDSLFNDVGFCEIGTGITEK